MLASLSCHQGIKRLKEYQSLQSTSGWMFRRVKRSLLLSRPWPMMKSEMRWGDGFEYDLFFLCYVDDVLCIHHDIAGTLNKLNRFVPLKPGSVRGPDIYLMTKHNRMQLYYSLLNESDTLCLGGSYNLQELCIKEPWYEQQTAKRVDNSFWLSYSPEYLQFWEGQRHLIISS